MEYLLIALAAVAVIAFMNVVYKHIVGKRADKQYDLQLEIDHAEVIAKLRA